MLGRHWTITLVTVRPAKHKGQADGAKSHMDPLSLLRPPYSYPRSGPSCQVDLAFETLGNQEFRLNLSLLGSNTM